MDQLAGITTITGGFFIRSTANSLTSLEGLRSLTSIGKGIEIIGSDVSQLTNLDGLENVKSVGNRIFIEGTSITNTNGLNGINEIIGDTLLIGGTRTFIDGSLQFINNRQLEIIDLGNLKKVEGEITIASNARLKSIRLFSLESISEYLVIAANDSLSDISGLKNIKSIGSPSATQNVFSLNRNPLLANCCPLVDIVSRLRGVPFDISDNALGCDNLQSIIEDCSDDVPPGKTDLELNISTTNNTPSLYNTLPVTVTINNTSTVQANNITVSLATCGPNNEVPDLFFNGVGLVYANADYKTSTGSYDGLWQTWQIPELAAGASATLTIQVFTLTEEPINILATIREASPLDIDSSPNKEVFTSCTATEDDEAVLTLNAGGCVCPTVVIPVCGDNGKTYNNACEAECDGVTWTEGPCDNTASNIDLELDLTTPQINPSIYTKLPLTVSVVNKGNIEATGVKINLTVCGGGSAGFQSASNIVYATTEYSATAGSYNYLNQNWTLPQLGAGETATLTVQLFTLSEDPINIGALVLEADQDDIDSTPDRIQNVGPCVVDEDDEVDLVLNGTSSCNCPTEKNQVCGSDGLTYDNACEAACKGVEYEEGACSNNSGEIQCDAITITYQSGNITMTGTQGEAYFFKVYRRQPVWEHVFECNSKCGSTQTVTDLSNGTYYVDVYDESWHLICDDIEVVLGEGALTEDEEATFASFKIATNDSRNLTEKFLVYPNPTSNLVQVELQNRLLGNHQIIINDNLGKVVKIMNLKDNYSTEFTMSEFTNGVYQITVIADNKIIGQQKLVVVK